MSLFIPITKIDIARQLVYGTLSEEIADKSGEILDYASAKPAFQVWSQQFHEASGGRSMGNVRAMHGNVAAGKLTDIDFDDDNKRITGVARIVDVEEWRKVVEGVYTGFSIGGGYAKRWRDMANPGLMRYTPVLTEVSLVDNPALPTATFEVIKYDGSIECRKFIRNPQEKLMHKTIEDDRNYTEDLLTALDWLAQYVIGKEEETSVMTPIMALQQYLNGEVMENKTSGDSGKVSKKLDFNTSIVHTIATLHKRIQQLESQPMPYKGSLRAISKSDDRSGYNEAVPKSLNTTELMKMALANPVEI